MKVIVVALGILAAAFAGCTSDAGVPNTGPPPAGPASRIVPGVAVEPIVGDPIPDGPGHDHGDPSQHEVALNMELVARPIPEGKREASFDEVDARSGWLAHCSGFGVLLYDLSDPANPVHAATATRDGFCSEVKLTADAEYMLVQGAELWDLRDKSEPKKVFEDPRFQCHMCAIHEIDGVEYAFLSLNGRGLGIAKITREPAKLEMVGEWGYGRDCVEAARYGTLDKWVNTRLSDPECVWIAEQLHDMYVYDDPLLGVPVVVAAYWDTGVWLLDASDPANLVEMGRWDAFFAEPGNLHTVGVGFLNVSGETRRIVTASTETGLIWGPSSAATPAYVYVFDATDVTAIRLVTRWENPGGRPAGANPTVMAGITGEYSTHNHQFVDGRIVLAHYHAGVWVLDVQGFLDGARSGTTVRGDETLATLAVWSPGDAEAGGPGLIRDVFVYHGFTYASDPGLGLFVLHFLGDARYDPAVTSDA